MEAEGRDRFMASTVILVSTYDPGYLQIFESLVRDEIEEGNAPIVFDITALSATPIDSYHRGILRAFGLPFPGHDIRERLSTLGARYVQASGLIEFGGSAALAEPLEESLSIAVQSALITFYRTDRPDQSKRQVRETTRRLTAEGRSVYRAARALVKSAGRPAYAYLPNGRFPHQKLATLAFHDDGVPTRHIEKGEGANRAYVQEYAPQDRLRSQGAVGEVLEGLSEAEIDGIADGWLNRRAPASDSRNEFSSLWSDTLPPEIARGRRENRPIVGFFTSSQDEFQFLGPEWQLHSWVDQMSAFDQVLTRLEESGYDAYLRVHPNLATKADECFRRERAGIRALAAAHPRLTVIWHDDQANSYALLAASDAVVVWDSTIGLEASARGLPVWTMATSRYGLVADTKELLGPEDLDSVGLGLWDVDSHRAKRFIAYLVLRDRNVRTDGSEWTEWAKGSPPLTAKLAAIAVSGGSPSTVGAIRSLVDVYLHRGIRANLRALRRR